MMIKINFKSAIICFSLLFIFTNCQKPITGNGNVIKKERETGIFNKVELSGSYTVKLKQSEEDKLIIETDENIQDVIRVKTLEDSTLRINNNKPIGEVTKLVIHLDFKTLHKLRSSGALNLSNADTIREKSLSLTSSGASKIKTKLLVERLSLNVSGAGKVVLSGEAKECNYNISGAGEIKALDLKTDKAAISITGAGKALVFVNKKLDINITGAGEIIYKGDPEITKSVSGTGEIQEY